MCVCIFFLALFFWKCNHVSLQEKWLFHMFLSAESFLVTSKYKCKLFIILLLFCWFFFCFALFFWKCNHMNLQGKIPVLCVSFSWIILSTLKNIGVNFLLSYCIICLVLLVFFVFLYFFWDCNHVDLQGERTICVFLSVELYVVVQRIQT